MDRRKLLSGLGCASLAATPAFAFDRINYVAGLPVGTFDNTHLFVEPGSIALWDGNPGWGIVEVELTSIVMIDMNHVGINGRDAGSFSDGCYLVYMLYNPTTQVIGFVASKAIDFGGVVKPAGFTAWRKMQYGATVRSGRVLPTHVSNYPMPSVEFTDNDTMMTVCSIASTNNNWVPINLAGWIPANSRLGLFGGRITGGAGSLWISPNGITPANPYWKTLMENQSGVGGSVPCRVDSNQTLFVWFSGPGTGQVILRGFDITEVT